MARKTDSERLQELEEKMEKMKAQKQQVESRIKQKERKERTKRLIEIGAIFEHHFEITSKEEAEKIAWGFKKIVTNRKEDLSRLSIEELQKQGEKELQKK
ncbi:hypothetical protein [Peribacillus muralis]|uniref:hypothetical protein n=1 Tax=Peribacillus muralis TaxID=264697 RepID=UPI003CFDA20A